MALKHRSAATVMFTAMGLALFVARLGEVWLPFVNGGASRAAPLAAALAVLPVAGLLSAWARRAVIGLPVTAALIALPLVLACGATPLRTALHFDTSPLRLGLSPDQEALVEGLKTHTNAEARILLDEIPSGSRVDWNWTAMLPTLRSGATSAASTPDARFEHAHCA